MSSPASDATQQRTPEQVAVSTLYHRLLDGWNTRRAEEFAAPFADDGDLVGFDGSQVSGRDDIESHIREIFADHQTPAYVGKIRDVRLLSPEVAVLRAVAGMVPPGGVDLEPGLNAVQTLIATLLDGQQWRIVLYQNTPAQFHGRPELAAALTDELRQLLPSKPSDGADR